MAGSTKIQPVITCFLKKGNKLYLFQRSAKVGHYRNYWAGISGFLEAGENPLERAEREVEEETGLIPPDVLPVLEGRPLIVNDGKLRWCVHPFLFEVRSPESIRLDKEHVACKSVIPPDLPDSKVIPGLWEAYRRIDIPEMIIKRLESLRSDRKSGSSELGAEAIEILSAASNGFSPDTAAGYFEHLLDIAWLLIRTRPGMAPVQNEVMAILNLLQNEMKLNSSLQVFKLAFRMSVNKYRKEKREAREHLQKSALLTLQKCKTLLTHSYSSSVVDILTAWSAPGKRLFVTESRPAYEGHAVARLLSRVCDVTLVTEAQVGSVMEMADAVVVGADSILADGSVLNKAGTYLAALAAKDKKKKFYIIADSTKFHPGSVLGMEIPHELHDPSEIFSEYSVRIQILNDYFDCTPERLISGVLTEKGMLKNAALKNQIKRSSDLLGILGPLGNYCDTTGARGKR